MTSFTRHGNQWFCIDDEQVQGIIPCDVDGWISIKDMRPDSFDGLLISSDHGSWRSVAIATAGDDESTIVGWQPVPLATGVKS